MDKLTFGLTLTIVGVGGTFVTLTALIMFIEILKKVFPILTGPANPGQKG